MAFLYKMYQQVFQHFNPLNELFFIIPVLKKWNLRNSDFGYMWLVAPKIRL
jgi:hypothetical protein